MNIEEIYMRNEVVRRIKDVVKELWAEATVSDVRERERERVRVRASVKYHNTLLC